MKHGHIVSFFSSDLLFSLVFFFIFLREQKELMKRPARRQIEPEDASKVHWQPEGAEVYNIWYHKWSGVS